MANLEDIVSLAKRRGFVYPSSEIYGGLSGVYDYGPLGVMLKHNLENIWWDSFVSSWDDMYPMDASILMNRKVWEASGHASGFNDPLVECGNCHSRFREDHVDHSKPCPVCGKKDTYGQARQFNMMFRTMVGTQEDETNATFLRPETAQGMFVNFKNLVDTVQPDLPFGMAQIGKGFRNEISPRDWLFRLREFDMMEIEYFVHPDKWEHSFEQWRQGMNTFFEKVGIKGVSELEVPEADRAHYSKRTVDFEYEYPFGKAELAGLAYRTDYDLKHHQEASGKNLEYRPKDDSEPFLPHVIEPSMGVDRLILAVLSSAYCEDEQGGEKRIFLKLAPGVAPVKAAVSPLLKNKPELVEKARQVYQHLKGELGEVMWDDNGNIGKRYRRQDEIGTPYCVTVDFQTLEDHSVTIRNRDTTEQIRVKGGELIDHLQ